MQVLLVGGATRMPAFRRCIENMTGLRPLETLVDPDEVRVEHYEKCFCEGPHQRASLWPALVSC